MRPRVRVTQPGGVRRQVVQQLTARHVGRRAQRAERDDRCLDVPAHHAVGPHLVVRILDAAAELRHLGGDLLEPAGVVQRGVLRELAEQHRLHLLLVGQRVDLLAVVRGLLGRDRPGHRHPRGRRLPEQQVLRVVHRGLQELLDRRTDRQHRVDGRHRHAEVHHRPQDAVLHGALGLQPLTVAHEAVAGVRHRLGTVLAGGATEVALLLAERRRRRLHAEPAHPLAPAAEDALQAGLHRRDLRRRHGRGPVRAQRHHQLLRLRVHQEVRALPVQRARETLEPQPELRVQPEVGVVRGERRHLEVLVVLVPERERDADPVLPLGHDLAVVLQLEGPVAGHARLVHGVQVDRVHHVHQPVGQR